MSVLSAVCCALLSAVCAFTLVSAAGCGANASGVEDCRQIEQARCSAAKSCGISDVAACQRFYRDQCLHGLPVASPGSVRVRACVDRILMAGVCATPTDPPRDGCTSVDEACSVVNSPETTEECSFLVAGAVPGAGGAGTAGSSGAAAGAEDSAGTSGN